MAKELVRSKSREKREVSGNIGDAEATGEYSERKANKKRTSPVRRGVEAMEEEGEEGLRVGDEFFL